MKSTLVLVMLLFLASCGKSGSGSSGSSSSNTLNASGSPQAQTIINNLQATGIEFVDDGDRITVVCKNNFSITNAERINSLNSLITVVQNAPQATFDFQYGKLYPFQMQTLLLSTISTLKYAAGYYSNYCPANIIGELNY